ncbi:hypothetical protein N7470_001442 [Penicillium chermesinum]|nr:hypothetical protein N7470_001442 [Penicillium chermesinum]
MRQRPRDPLTRFADFWRDPEGVGRFEDYTEAIGVCAGCFEPGTSSLNAPRKHHYRGRRYSADRLSSSSSSRVSKLNRYQSSEDDTRSRRRSKNTSSSWLPGVLGASLFAGKEFHDSYSVRSGYVADDRASSFDESQSVSDRRSYTSRGVVRRSGRDSSIEYNSKRSRRTRSRSRSSSRSGHRSYVKEAAIGAAVGSAALAAAKSSRRNRSRSPHRRKDSTSSSSVIDVSRSSGPKSVGGFTSFFTASSENRTKKSTKKKRRGFFSFSGSSSSSLDNDLAFGTGFAKKPSKTLKKKNGKKTEDVDAALLGLSATATALAASSPHGRSRSTGQIMNSRDTRYLDGKYTSSANEDDEWVDAESSDQSPSSVSSAMAFGGSSAESGSDSSRSGFFSSFFGRKKSRSKKSNSSAGDAAVAAGAGALGAAALTAAARDRDRDSRVSSSAGSLQQVYPIPTSDPSRFDVTKVSSSSASDQPAFVRPGPIPLQQPQPVMPVSQSVYSTQGGLPGSIPAYSGPVPPIFANEFDQYGPQSPALRDAAWIPDDSSFVGHPMPRRSNSSPVFPAERSSMAGPKRRFTSKDQASVSWNLTKEQEEQENRANKRNSKPRDDFQPGAVQLIDREQEPIRREPLREEPRRRDLDRQDRRRVEQEEETHRSNSGKDKDTPSWVDPVTFGVVGAAAGAVATSALSRKHEEEAEQALRREERRNKRREERRLTGSDVTESPIVAAPEPPVSEPPAAIEDKYAAEEYQATNYKDKRDISSPAEVLGNPPFMTVMQTFMLPTK